MPRAPVCLNALMAEWLYVCLLIMRCRVLFSITGFAQICTSVDGMEMAADWGVVMGFNSVRAIVLLHLQAQTSASCSV